jgi:hypothetical protein
MEGSILKDGVPLLWHFYKFQEHKCGQVMCYVCKQEIYFLGHTTTIFFIFLIY